MKRLFDLLVSGILLVVVSPLALLVAVLVLAAMGRPIVFKQKRLGLHGKSFPIYKFRTMSTVQDAAGKLLPDVQRVTALGASLRRSSLDELPQLLNVLKGDMSLVGPRPLLVEYLPLYNSEQARRHAVKPGLTGWAQVNGRNAISWEQKFALDVWYVDNQSFALDMRILWLTFLRLFKQNDVNASTGTTMPKFEGSSSVAARETSER
jgi:sugar transferase EpsL